MPGPVRRLLVGHALASVGMSLPWPLLLVLVWDRTGDSGRRDLLVGLTGAARLLPYVLLSWATGALADRFRRDALVRVTLLVRVALLAVVAVAVLQGRLATAVVAASLAVAAGTPAYPALAAAMPQAAGARRRRATDLLVTIEVASFVVGPALGGLLLAGPTRPWLPLVAVLTTASALPAMSGVRLPRTAPATVPAGSPARALCRSGAALRAVGLAGLLNAVDAALLLALLPLAERAWSGGDRGYGLATGALGFGALAAPVLWRLGTTARSRAGLGLLLLAGTLLVVPFTPAVGWALVPLLVAGAATVHVEGALTETVQDAVPDRSRAGVLGVTDSVMVGAALLASLVTPWLAGELGSRGLVLALAAVTVAGLAGLARVPRVPGPPAVRRGAAPPRIPQQRRPVDGPALRRQRAGTDSTG